MIIQIIYNYHRWSMIMKDKQWLSERGDSLCGQKHVGDRGPLKDGHPIPDVLFIRE